MNWRKVEVILICAAVGLVLGGLIGDQPSWVTWVVGLPAGYCIAWVLDPWVKAGDR